MAAKRSALGTTLRTAYMRERPTVAPARAATAKAAATGAGRVRLSVYISRDLLERTRAAVDFLSGPPLRLTYTAFLDRALTSELDRLQKAHNGGKPFPPQAAPLRHARAVTR